MRVVGYVRVSTEEQAKDGNSIEEQKERITDECKRKGWGVPEFYIDDGYSGKDMKRPQIQRLVENVKKGMYTIIITTKLDRLSRKLYETLKFLETLQSHNTRYYCCNMDLDFSTPQGMLMLQQMGSYAEFEREMIRERVRDNMLSIARKATATKKAFTVPCYGYDVEDGKYVINPEEAKVIKIMVDIIKEGRGHREVAKRLNEMGYKSKQGKAWGEIAIRQLLVRETLIGQLIYNRTYKKNGRTYVRPQEEWIIIEDHHEPILDEETFNEIQSIIVSRKTARKQADNSKWLLSGLVICGHCGSKMKGIAYSKKYKNGTTGEFNRYVCSTYHKSGLCFFHYVHRDELEQLIRDEIARVGSATPESKLQLITAPKRSEANEQQNFEAQLRKLDQKMQKQIEAYEEDLISAADLKKARERIDQQRAAIVEMMKGMEEAASTDQDVVGHVKRHMHDAMSEDRLTAKRGISRCIDAITITDGSKISIRWKTT